MGATRAALARLFPVARMKWQPASIEQNDHDSCHRALTSVLFRTVMPKQLEGAPPEPPDSSALVFVGILPNHHPLLRTFETCEHSGVGISQHRQRDARSHAPVAPGTGCVCCTRFDRFHRGRRDSIPSKPNLETGQMFRLAAPFV